MISKPSINMKPYGALDRHTLINMVSLKNSVGTEVDIISYGGIITRISTIDKNGKFSNIVLAMESLQSYIEHNPYFGAIIGRYGNRIANGEFMLEGKRYVLAKNDGNNHLHGGVQGFDKKVWKMTPFVTDKSAGVTLSLDSPDNDQGYPGNLHSEVTYTLTNNNELNMYFTAVTDKTTVVNFTQHSYFNLSSKGDILAHKLKINASSITSVDRELIPTGEFMSVKNTPFNFVDFKPIGKDINENFEQLVIGSGYDHNFVLKYHADDELKEAAIVHDPLTGRVLTIYTDAPAIQFYSGNFLDGGTSNHDHSHGYRSGFCLEPQYYPDSPNHSTFPSVTLMPGEQYSMQIVYKFSVK